VRGFPDHDAPRLLEIMGSVCDLGGGRKSKKGRRVMVMKRTAVAAAIALAMTGCGTPQDNPVACKGMATAIGGAVGATAGGVLVSQYEGGHGGDDGEIAAGAGGGLVAGGLTGYLLGHYLCPEPEVAPPPPPPPPAKGTKIAEIAGPNFDFN